MGRGTYSDPFAGGGRTEQYTVGAGEHQQLRYIILPGESRSVDVGVDLVGEGARVDISGLYLSGSDEQVDIRILVHHRAAGCTSVQRFRGLAAGRARARFDGRVVVAPGAMGTEAYQEDHNILLSPEARIEALPQLEIYADDVRCSHGATVGRLNEEEQFYMRSRGIPDAEARILQLLSFVSPVIAGDDALRRKVEDAIRKMNL